MEKVAAVVDIGSNFSPAKSIPDFGTLVSVIIKNAFVVAGVISFIILIVGGFGVIVSAGNPKKTEAGKQAITGAVVGLILVVGSFWIVQIIEVITGMTLLP